jgi:hypothetical protein
MERLEVEVEVSNGLCVRILKASRSCLTTYTHLSRTPGKMYGKYTVRKILKMRKLQNKITFVRVFASNKETVTIKH